MDHQATEGFWRLYEELSPKLRSRARKQFKLLKTDPQHPSLEFKKLTDRRGQELWSARVSLGYRALAIKQADRYLWFWIGTHGAYDRIIAQ